MLQSVPSAVCVLVLVLVSAACCTALQMGILASANGIIPQRAMKSK